MSKTIEVKRRMAILKEALRLLGEILSIVPQQRDVLKYWPKLRHKCGYFDRGMIQRKVKTGIEKTFHSGLLIDWPRFTALSQCLADRLSQCGLEYHDTYNLASQMIGNARLIKERPWRSCMYGLRMILDWELNAAGNPACDASGDCCAPQFKINPPTDPEIISFLKAFQRHWKTGEDKTAFCREYAKKHCPKDSVAAGRFRSYLYRYLNVPK